MSGMSTQWGWFLGIVIGGASFYSANSSLAQITLDKTLKSREFVHLPINKPLINSVEQTQYFDLSSLTTKPFSPQSVDVAQLPRPQDVQPTLPKPLLPSQPPDPLPPPSNLLRPSNPVLPNQPLPSIPGETFIVEQFDVVGSTVFSRKKLAKVLAGYTHRPISFASKPQSFGNERKNKGFSPCEQPVFSIGLRAIT